MDPQEPSTSYNRAAFEIISSQRGKPLLLRAGYRYDIKRKNKNKSTVWRCVKREICQAILIITCANSIKREDNHNCQPDTTKNECDIEMDGCQKKIINDVALPIPAIFRETIGSLKDKGLDLIKNLPEFKNIKNKFYRKRNKSLGVDKVWFKNVSKVSIPPKFQNFLFADYCSKNRILIFASKLARNLFCNTNYTVLCDGTFKFCAKPFYQLYTLHVDIGSSKTKINIVPVIYALLPNKTEKTYEIMLRLIKSQIPDWTPKTFILDYEKAVMQAIKSVFPNTPISGCYFHFSRCLWRKAKKLGIHKSKLIKKHIRKCTALALLPRHAVDDAFLHIMARSPNNDQVTKFNDYFVETWLTETAFFHDKWCCYDQKHRTTNIVESWHATVNKKGYQKPQSIAHFLTDLQREANYYDTLVKKGSNIYQKKKETQEIDDYIEHVLKDFVDSEISVGMCLELLVF
ncbi:uncharacterized protein LOC126381107 [Pectinophora gossypiella]|uniref:uncharacterized protein LOC126381107 n=1 Tax=Pectinophora gossypiella TaxID=13191 RepID=UPI00214F15A6|nr:uncharacterized protein LOC126381107 [Pectinophora gossypiella]